DGALDSYWKFIFKICKVDPDKVWHVNTTVDNVRIIAYFNSGVIFSNPKRKLFQNWESNFEKLSNDANAFNLKGLQYFFLDQALLSATIMNLFLEAEVKNLENNYNFPILLQKELDTINISKIKIFHY